MFESTTQRSWHAYTNTPRSHLLPVTMLNLRVKCYLCIYPKRSQLINGVFCLFFTWLNKDMKKVHLKDACFVTSSSRRHASHSDYCSHPYQSLHECSPCSVPHKPCVTSTEEKGSLVGVDSVVQRRFPVFKIHWTGQRRMQNNMITMRAISKSLFQSLHPQHILRNPARGLGTGGSSFLVNPMSTQMHVFAWLESDCGSCL